MERTRPVPAWHTAATSLAHGVGFWAAQVAGARVLVVKGKGAEFWELREPRVSADVDLLAEPARLNALVSALARTGWRPRETSYTYKATTTHAVSLIHRDWPCDIDVHGLFPGMLGDPAEHFECLWTGREHMRVAGVKVAIPNRAHSALILGLHALHSAASEPRHGREFVHLAELMRKDQSLARSVLEAASELGAIETVAPLLQEAGLKLPPTVAAPSDELLAWRTRGTAGSNPTVVSLNYILALPLGRRPGAMWRLFWPTAQDIRRDHPEIGEGSGAILRARGARVRRGLASMPGAVSARARARRGLHENQVAEAARRYKSR